MNYDKPYPTQRGYFAYYLYEEMKENKDIYLVTGDLGYHQFDKIFEDFPDRAINCGASEQAGVGLCIGLALEGKIPFFNSITNFTLYRPYEWIRNYIDYEKIPVILIGNGRDDDYKDGYTHQSFDAKRVLKNFQNIHQIWTKDKESIPKIIKKVTTIRKPYFISLSRNE